MLYLDKWENPIKPTNVKNVKNRASVENKQLLEDLSEDS